MNRVEIKKKAKELIKGHIWQIFGIVILLTFISGAINSCIENLFKLCGFKLTRTITLNGLENVEISTVIGSIVNFITVLVSSVISVGTTNYILMFIRGKNPKLNDAFTIIQKLFVPILLSTILVSLITSIGYILLFIPGIIASLGLRFYQEVIIDDTKNKGVVENLKDAWELTKGYKWDLFAFGLSFVGWILLCVLIVPIFYVIPYITVSEALYYDELKNKKRMI